MNYTFKRMIVYSICVVCVVFNSWWLCIKKERKIF